MRYNNFICLTKYLKENLPVTYPVQVRRTNIRRDYDGDCQLHENKFIIRVQKSLPEYYAMEVLLHEFGHCLSWDKEEDIHGPVWGKAYSIVYRKFLEWHNS